MFLVSWLRDQISAPRSNRVMQQKRLVRSHRLVLERLEDRCFMSAGDLDLSFGTNGVVAADAGGPGSLAAIALAPDGRIVNGGSRSTPNGNIDFALSRFRSDGALDSSFGAGGWVTTGFGGTSDDRARAVTVLPDGRVLAGGFSNYDFALVRYTATGAVDTTFGGKVKGLVVTDISSRSIDNAEAMVAQADGKVVLAGITQPRNTSFTDLALVRYNSNGSLDTSFDGDGKRTVHFAGPLTSESQDVAVAVYPVSAPGGLGGKLLAAAAITYPNSGVVLTRFNADGSQDMSFGGGTGSVYLSNSWWKPDVAIQPDGKIVLSAKNQDSTRAMLARFDTAGNLDAGFGAGGVTGTVLPSPADQESLALQPDGKILVSANQHADIGVDYPLVLRYDASGSLDPTFGTNGMVTQPAVALSSAAIDLALQPDGRIVLGGSKFTPGAPGRWDFVLMRLQGDAGTTAAATATAAREVQETLAAATRPSPLGGRLADWPPAVDVVFSRAWSKKARR